jgi:MFS family permease
LGHLSDRYGRRLTNIWPRIALTVLIVPLFLWLTGSPSLVTLLTVNAVLAALTAMFGAAGIVQVPELLPIAVRSTGLSITYAIGAAIFGGSTQFIVTWLIAVTGSPMAPAWYLVVISLVSLVAMRMLPESRDTNVQE